MNILSSLQKPIGDILPEYFKEQTKSQEHPDMNRIESEHPCNYKNEVNSHGMGNDNYKKKIIISKIKLINNNNNLNNIFLFIKKYNITHTVNSNGVFFNLNTLNSKKLDKLYLHVNTITNSTEKINSNNLFDVKKRILYKNNTTKNNILHFSLSYNDLNDFERDIINYI